MTESTNMKDPEMTLAKSRFRTERVFAQIDRTAAWLSALLLFLFIVSGYGMTKPDFVNQATGGLITWRVAYDMHNLLILPIILTFIVHTITGLRRALARRTKQRRKSAWIAVGAGVVVLTFLLVLVLAPTGF